MARNIPDTHPSDPLARTASESGTVHRRAERSAGVENILGDEAHTGDDEHEVVDSKPDLRELILWLGIDLIAQSPEDIMADGGRALVENCRSFPWPEIVGEFFKRLSGYAEIIAAFEWAVQALAHYREMYHDWEAGTREACLVESIILDECLRCAIEHAGANEPLATRLAKIRSHLPVRIGEMGITETAALLPKSWAALSGKLEARDHE